MPVLTPVADLARGFRHSGIDSVAIWRTHSGPDLWSQCLPPDMQEVCCCMFSRLVFLSYLLVDRVSCSLGWSQTWYMPEDEPESDSPAFAFQVQRLQRVSPHRDQSIFLFCSCTTVLLWLRVCACVYRGQPQVSLLRSPPSVFWDQQGLSLTWSSLCGLEAV